MGIRITDRDIRRGEIAQEINAALVGTGIHVVAGGEKGPYTLVVNRLNRRQLDAAIGAVRLAAGR